MSCHVEVISANGRLQYRGLTNRDEGGSLVLTPRRFCPRTEPYVETISTALGGTDQWKRLSDLPDGLYEYTLQNASGTPIDGTDWVYHGRKKLVLTSTFTDKKAADGSLWRRYTLVSPFALEEGDLRLQPETALAASMALPATRRVDNRHIVRFMLRVRERMPVLCVLPPLNLAIDTTRLPRL